MTPLISIIEGDITDQDVDAIVNAANPSLLGGGGVDGAIHRRAGTGLLEECRGLGGCETGDARITGGHALPARHVIHTVGPVWRGGGHGEDELLCRCYRSCLGLAARHGLRIIAFPSISTGAYGYPFERATDIALAETARFMGGNERPGRVIFVCFGRAAYDCYAAALAKMEAKMKDCVA